MSPAVLRYREYAPCEALRDSVRAFFSFTAPSEDDHPNQRVTREIAFGPDDPFSSPLFADGHVSLVFSLGTGYRVDGLWDPNTTLSRGHAIGAITAGRAASPGDHIETIGVYFHPAQAQRFLHVPASELTDRIVALKDLWGAAGAGLDADLSETVGDATRIVHLESALLNHRGQLRTRSAPVDIAGLAAWALRRSGQLTVERMADAAGVSRQHLTRSFRETVGVTPKLYCRLARFRAALSLARHPQPRDGAGLAADLGYADQSHMIAEFREFSGLTPGTLTPRSCFHPLLGP